MRCSGWGQGASPPSDTLGMLSTALSQLQAVRMSVRRVSLWGAHFGLVTGTRCPTNSHLAARRVLFSRQD